MSDPQLSFKTKTELLDWFKAQAPEWVSEYPSTLEKIKQSGFPGVIKLLKKEPDETLYNFLTFLTELNVANLLLDKEKRDLCYEPKGIGGVDFSFDHLLVSVKSLNTKNYEKVEQEEIERLKNAGGGQNVLTHKNFSSILLEVEKNETGTYMYSRTETGHSGFLDSDLAQMSPPLKYIGEFEGQSNTGKHKKVLFFLNYSQEFRHYHALDIALWYFNALPKNYQRIFQQDPNLYFKLLAKEKKENTVHALVFMFPPNPLIWPASCYGDVISDKRRVLIFCPDPNLEKELMAIFS